MLPSADAACAAAGWIRLPGVLLAVEADQAAQQEDRQRDVGIDPE
jgi:hypothetical protein